MPLRPGTAQTSYHSDRLRFRPLRFSWTQHQQVARLIQSVMVPTKAAAGPNPQGEALALMGVALLLLMQDLALLETPLAVSPD